MAVNFRPSVVLGLLIAATSGLSCSGARASEPASLPLLHEDDLRYVGAIRIPRKDQNGNRFTYGGRSLAYNPAANSLILMGNVRQQMTAELSIPEPVNSPNTRLLPTARVLQPLTDATAGRLRQIDRNDRNGVRLADHLVVGNRLLISGYAVYDANGSQSYSHFVRPLDLAIGDQVTGPVAVGDDVHFTSGYMGLIPPSWQPYFGAPAVTGNCCRSIISNQSHGPALFAFDPESLQEGKRTKAQALLYYNGRHPLGPGNDTTNPLFNRTTRVEGVIFPVGTRSVLFFGKHGTGEFCYGTGAECNDPVRSRKGNHAYPYIYQVWAYDAAQLLKVAQGKARPWSVQPYATWRLTLPHERDDDHDIGGVAYDPARRIMYLSQLDGDKDRLPLIHALSVGPFDDQ